MRERSKQLADAIPPPILIAVTRSSIGRGDAQRFTRIVKVGECRILAQAGQHPLPGIGHDKFERASRRSIGDQSAVAIRTMLMRVFLQFTPRADQPRRKARGNAATNRGIFRVAEPLLPRRRISVVPIQGERKDTGDVPGARSAYAPVAERFEDSCKDRRIDANACILGRHLAYSIGHFDKRTNQTGPLDHDRRMRGQSTVLRLPEKVVSDVEPRREQGR